MNLKEIEARIAEIKNELETRAAELTVEESNKLVDEAEQLNEQRKALVEAAEKRKAEGRYTKYPYWLWNRDISGKNNPMYGKKHTQEVLEKKYKPVLQFSKQGEYMAEYKSIKEAAITVNISETHLVSALRGRSKTAAGYIWKYKQ